MRSMAIKECEDTRKGGSDQRQTLLITGYIEIEEQAKGTEVENLERQVREKKGKPEECGMWRQRGAGQGKC